MRFTVDRLDHLVITCRDVERTASWYQRVLGMEREEYGRRNRNALRFGGQKINLRPWGAEGWETAETDMTGTQDLCFATTLQPEDTIEHLTACGVAVTDGPIERPHGLRLLPRSGRQPDRARLLSWSPRGACDPESERG